MPTYTFKNKETGEITQQVMRMSELEAYKASNPQLETYIDNTPGFADPVSLGRIKIDNGFREVLTRIAERTPGGQGLKSQIR